MGWSDVEAVHLKPVQFWEQINKDYTETDLSLENWDAMPQALVFSYTCIRDWVPIALSVGVVLVSFRRVLVVSLLYSVFRLIRAYLLVGLNFIAAESFRANKDQWLASSSSIWCSLPEDLVTDQILSRLPVKSLMRFKSVCKRWYSLPTNPSFIASHLKHSTTCNSLASWNANIGPMFENIFSSRFYSLAFQPVNLNFGLDRKPDLVLGPCDGLFCLYWKHPRDFWTSWRSCRDYPPLRTIALWNPATRVFSILPMSKLEHPPYKTMVACLVGFGFDLTTKSIKVVKFVGFYNNTSYVNCAEVYDVGSGSWRVVHVDDTAQAILDLDDPTHCRYNTNDGVFHWYAYRWRGFSEFADLLVLSFDMSRELFHVTLMLDKYNPVNPRTRHPTTKLKECQFSLSRDSLAVHFSLFVAGHGTVEIWVMKKDFYHGFEGGEYFSYSLSHELTVELPYTRPCLSMGFWNKNELLLWEVDVRSERTPFLYDIVTKQARDLAHLGELNFFTYEESLVSVNGGCGNNNGCVSFL